MLLTFDFKTVEEAQEFLKGLTGGRQPEAAPTQGLPTAPVGPSKDSDDHLRGQYNPTPPAPEKKKRGPKPKAAPLPEKEYGIEDCRTALSALFDIKGRDAAKAALADFKVARIGELKADQYAAFVAMCEDLGRPE